MQHCKLGRSLARRISSDESISALAITIDDIDFKIGTVNIIHLKGRLRISCEKCGASLALSHIYYPKCEVKTNADS